MTLRLKFLRLLLIITLAPLLASSLIQRYMTRQLGQHVGRQTRNMLESHARTLLQGMALDHERLVDRTFTQIAMTVRLQAREVEYRLALPAPPAGRVVFSGDYDLGRNLPPGMAPSSKHLRANPKGELTPVPVTYDEQVYFLARGVAPEDVTSDLARLSTMPEVYRKIHDSASDLLYWQYTSLESGIHTSYPGHGGYPPDYDPRQRAWYRRAKAAGDLVWEIMPEVSTRTVTYAIAAPVYTPDKRFAGVTAIDIPLSAALQDIGLPPAWKDHAETMLVVPWKRGAIAHRGYGEAADSLLIAAHRRYERRNEDWRKRVALEYLESDNPEEIAAILADIKAGRPGVRLMPYEGRDCLWAYGKGHAPLLVIVPYDLITDMADKVENRIWRQTVVGLQISGGLLLAMIALAIGLAIRSARKLTQPLSQLSQGARRLSEGDFAARVRIKTGDELERLGDAFNDMGPKLEEREKMKRSLALAMEIQQHLLPHGAPEVAGFDIYGHSVYCDETGGDYFDFIELVATPSGRLGIAVGDVSGHGIAAALLMASTRAVLRSHALHHDGDLAALFDDLNRHIAADVADGQFVTLFYGVLDPQSRNLSWTSAGHDPALLIRAGSGEIEDLPNTGLPIGILAVTDYEQLGPVPIRPGDVLVVGTDGIWETRNAAGEMFGKPRFRELLLHHANEPAQAIYEAIVSAVTAHAGETGPDDDVTLVVIRAR